MAEYIGSLSIRGFRNLSRFDVSHFGNVNLITGKNNAGKSTVLEAIRILASGGSLRTLQDILVYRDELNHSVDAERVWGPSDATPFSNLFTGFPNLSGGGSKFSITANGNTSSSIAITAGVGWVARRVEDERIYYEPAVEDLFGEGEVSPGITLELRGRKVIIPIDRFLRRPYPRLEADAVSLPCIYLDPFSSRSTSQMGTLWDSIALTDVEPEIVQALKIVSEDIMAVSVVGGGDRLRGRTAIAKSSAFLNPVPLRTFGDGVNRLFGIILSLCNAKGGILLVDEIENGLHHSAQTEIWKTIFRLAAKLNVQVFATSHSWDCVQAFQEAATESPSQGVLVRLSRRGDRIFPTTFSEQELNIATRDQIEVR